VCNTSEGGWKVALAGVSTTTRKQLEGGWKGRLEGHGVTPLLAPTRLAKAGRGGPVLTPDLAAVDNCANLNMGPGAAACGLDVARVEFLGDGIA
jgi:hypothetical protein